MFCVYILKSNKKTDQIYIGYTVNLKKRITEHNQGLSPSTKPYRPWRPIFCEIYINKQDAKRREKYLKTTKGRKAIKFMLKQTLQK
jgi:putative endonuclease